ncbi:MAG: hypothetical protein IPN31_00545 [Bacteroidetes bacterium]|nr:hypothetical protein [Bacteroidota bacterium]
MKKFTTHIILIIVAAILLNSCRRKEDTTWDIGLLTPILQGNLNITDILADSLKEINSDDGVDLVYRQQLIDLNLAEEGLSIPDTIVQVYVSLDSLGLTDRTLTNQISLGQVATALGFPYGTYIILNNGNMVPIDPILGFSSGEQPIDANSFFESATIETGFLDIQVYNGFPIPLTNLSLLIKNSSDGAIIVDETIPLIDVGETVISTTSLDGKTVDGDLIAEITNFDSPGSLGENVLIDTADAFVITMSAYDLNLLEATAIFPAQNLVNRKNDVVYDMGGPEFTSMEIKSGNVVIDVVSTMKDTIYIVYNIPGAVDPFGNNVSIITKVPPAPVGGSTTVSEAFPLDDYTVDLRGSSGIGYNTFYQEFVASIDSTGNVVTISLLDSISLVYGLKDIIPKSVEGYLGQSTEILKDTLKNIDVFRTIISGELLFDQVDVLLNIENGIGADANAILHSMTATNTRSGISKTLIAPTVVGQIIPVHRAQKNPFLPGITNVVLNTSNSNIKELLEILPDEISYDVTMDINPNGNAYNYQDFILEDSRLKANLDMVVPLNLIANDLVMQDKFSVDLNAMDHPENILSGDLILEVDNDFPFEAELWFVFIDEFGTRLDSLDFSATPIQAGVLSPDCRVYDSTNTEMKVFINEDRMQNFLLAENAIVTVRYNTTTLPGCGDHIRIYSDYDLHFNLRADFNYRINLGNY